MNKKPEVPKGYTLQTKPEACPDCGATCIARVGPQKRCGQCGLQWPPIRPMQELTRSDVLNGIARILPGRIIRWR